MVGLKITKLRLKTLKRNNNVIYLSGSGLLRDDAQIALLLHVVLDLFHRTTGRLGNRLKIRASGKRSGLKIFQTINLIFEK